METDCDTSLSDSYCLICGSSSVEGSNDDDDDKIAEIFLSCVDLTENSNDLSEHADGIEFCFKCKLKLEELDYVQSQIDRLLLRSRQLRMSIIADAIQQSRVPLENSSARWIRRLIRNKFIPRVLLQKCDYKRPKITTGMPRKSSSVARKRPTAHSLRIYAEPKGIQKPKDIESRSAMENFDGSSLFHIKFEEFESEEMEDLEMTDPLQLDGNEVTDDDNAVMLKYEGGDIEVYRTPGSTLREPILSHINVPTVTPLYNLLRSTVDSQMAANDYQIESNDWPVLLKDDYPASVGSVRAEPSRLVHLQGNSYRFGAFPVERMGNDYNCVTCSKTFSGTNSASSVKRHIRNIHESRQENVAWSTFERTLVRETSPQDFLYRDSIPFTFDKNEGSFTCGHCGVKFISCPHRPGKERIMKHLKHVHTFGKHGVPAPVPGEGEKSTRGMVSPMKSDGIVHSHCPSLRIEQAVLKLESQTQTRFPFAYKDSLFQCGLCPWSFQTDNKPDAQKYIVLHFQGQHLGERIKPANHKKKPVKRVRTVQNPVPARNTAVSEPVILQEEVGQEATEAEHKGSYQVQGVRVTVISDKHVCEAKGCSTFFVGKRAAENLAAHIGRCHLDVTEIKPGEYLYRRKLPFTYKNGVIQCGLCPRIFLTDKNPADENKFIMHFKEEHSGERKKRTDRRKIPVGSVRAIQSLPAANTVVSQPVTPVGQESPSIFHIQPYPLLQNGQTVFALVPQSNLVQQVCIAEPTVNMPSGPIEQFNSVSSIHSAGCSVTSNPPILPKSY